MVYHKYIIDDVQELKDDIEKDYKTICAAVPDFSKSSFEEFSRIRTLLNSRIFGTYIDGEEDDSMVPFADMFNYQWKTTMSKWTFDDDMKAFTVVSNEEIPRGNEVFISYGNKSNRNFFLFYGFVIDNNENDYAKINVYLNTDDKLKKLKDDLLDISANPYKCRIGCSPDNKHFYNTMSFVRFIEYEGDKEFLIKIKENCVKDSTETKPIYFKAKKIPMISKENEIKVLKTLKLLCRDSLYDYPTTIEEDIELLKDDKLTFNQRNCIIFRKGEKVIFKFYINFFDKVLNFLKGVI